jgi:hypothetical protein
MLLSFQLRLLSASAIFIIIHGVLLAQGTQAATQVPVTFYSSGSFLKSAIPGYKHGKFAGRIMDGQKQLAMLGFDRFITFNLEAGEHTLTANSWMLSSPVGGGHIKLDLLPGQHYYVATYLRDWSVVPDFRMEQRSCQQAQDDNQATKPLEQKHIKDYGLTRAVSEVKFPACP